MSIVQSTHALSGDTAEFRLNRLGELVRATRSGRVESVHVGALVVVDPSGRRCAAVGDPDLPVYWRSVAKPHQALALLQEGRVDELKLEDEHLAIISASHHASEEQVRCVREVLARSGRGPADLRCGAHPPVARSVSQVPDQRGQPTPLQNMCSGNHAGLLCLSKLLGADVADYDRLEHPAQQQLLLTVSAFTGLTPDEIQIGEDGCGIPTYRTPLWRLALAYARLAKPTPFVPAPLARAAERLFRALNAEPQLLSAEGELDVEFIRAFGGSGVCKLGAGGMLGACLKPSTLWPEGVGIALKVADGLGERARGVALLAAVEQLRLGTPEQRDRLRAHVTHQILNNRGEAVGMLAAAFDLRSGIGGSVS